MLTAEQQEVRPKWEERVASRMADCAPGLQLPLCCLPPSSDYLDPPRGVTRRHILSCPYFVLKKLLTMKAETGRCGYHLQQTCQMSPRANFPSHFFHLKRCFENSSSYNLHFSLVSPASNLPERILVPF